MRPTPAIDDDVRTLAAMGSTQELERRMGGFSHLDTLAGPRA